MSLTYDMKSAVWDALFDNENPTIQDGVQYFTEECASAYNRYRNYEAKCFNYIEKHGENNDELIKETRKALKTYLLIKAVLKHFVSEDDKNKKIVI